MIIEDCTRYEDGSVSFNAKINEEETSFLINHAITDLMNRGLIQINTEEAMLEVELLKDNGVQLN
jgi:hypothetical protein